MQTEAAGVDFAPIFALDRKLKLQSQIELDGAQCAYQTYGTLNADRSNAIMICHGLTGDQYVAGTNPLTGRAGWWDHVVGPGLVLDTDRYYVICANVLGSCLGTTGPSAINPETGRAWNMDFPVFTVADMVDLQVHLIDLLGIDRLFAVIGASMGGMLALDWGVRHSERVFASVPIATSWRHTAQNIAFHEVGRRAIAADANWHDGAYRERGVKPEKGLAAARMVAHITYLSEGAFQEKFGRELPRDSKLSFVLDPEFEVERYLDHQGKTFVKRFDAASYIYLTRAMDYFDLAAHHDGNLAAVFQGVRTRFLMISFTSDWLFPTAEARSIVRALNANAADVSFIEIPADYGHGSFLIENATHFHDVLEGFLDGSARRRGLSR